MPHIRFLSRYKFHIGDKFTMPKILAGIPEALKQMLVPENDWHEHILLKTGRTGVVIRSPGRR
jgi:hypothetical protein